MACSLSKKRSVTRSKSLLHTDSCMTLLDCARRCGVRRRTFQRWLEKEGYSVQRNGRTALVPVRVFEIVIAKRIVVKRFSSAK